MDPRGQLVVNTLINGHTVPFLRIDVREQGLVVFKRAWLLEPFPPILIPWTEVHHARVGSDLLDRPTFEFGVGLPPIASIKLITKLLINSPLVRRP